MHALQEDIMVHQHIGTIRKSCFNVHCTAIMDFFLSHANLYFTPYTVALSMEKTPATIKDCMRLLKQNSYLSKLSNDGTVYFITHENMEFWHVDFKRHVLDLQKLEEKNYE